VTLALITVPPYPVSACRLVLLLGLVFQCLTIQPVPAMYNHSTETNKMPTWSMDQNLSASDRQITWAEVLWLLNCCCCPNVWVELENSWVGKMGRKCTTWITEVFFLKMNSLCLGFGLVLLYFYIFLIDENFGWHGKHLLDNQHCIHWKWT